MAVSELDCLSKVTVQLGITRTNANGSQNWSRQLRLRRGFNPFARTDFGVGRCGFVRDAGVGDSDLLVIYGDEISNQEVVTKN